MINLRLVTVTLLSTLAFALPVSAQTGLASWYGNPYHGRRTACGETFNMHALTAAHRTLPCGTRVRVTTSAGRSVVVRINDRGPFVGGRIVDMSRAAMDVLRGRSAGVVRVTLTRLR